MDEEIERLVAATILQGSDAMYGRFLDVTAGAQERFEQQAWKTIQQALKKRINFYDHHVGLVSQQLKTMLNKQHATPSFFMGVKSAYCQLLDDYPRYDIAESFFNSVYCRIFDHRHIQRNKLFVNSSQGGRIPKYLTPLLKRYSSNNNLIHTVERLLDDTPFSIKWENKSRDVHHIVAALQNQLSSQLINDVIIDMIREPFYRNKAAYIIGRIETVNQIRPLVLPILINAQGELFVDACVSDSDDISVIFGFARSYFMVYAPVPAALVDFLGQLMPHKTPAQLYNSIGCQKHGKTELYREFLYHIDNSDDLFVIAPGIKGMVMSVFTLPSYGFVFKIIKDRFAPQKNITHAIVKEKYQLVKEHDRVGRMADTLDYRHFIMPRHRFSEELIEELLDVAQSNVKLTSKEIHISHLYMERRMIPLNIYLDQANEKGLRTAIQEYGDAIKQLAAANIFAGDMLFKNFGVSRHNRVIFYDYDEISYLTEINFRHIPPSRFPEDEMAAEPWYSVGENDVFPEEFRTFLLINPKICLLFNELHPNLFDADYWKRLQSNIKQGLFSDVFPYSEKSRFIALKPEM
ncbi:bifunctional isocitrate dehydrogenase kinase/phosphatase [Candidatus Enterovibrio escicola]|uniref:Isocitrate dehydrogenase kinase/phosphatase n=1 Tax=Candidatus Enterovibrio escicola TaxID=1927127 RepID=A0A2A5T666_9GAMM|nr:bifunctional isocitrate dehydrogenase kinase/phosphatase [Candidatus Enterovibrio escacola]PCS23590.1 Isocitrate dehydrogenase phosphatase /kinase [Candidatus Enterovibrio escacola]